jgi:predicted enzyme related to lactoylglutathione lyase
MGDLMAKKMKNAAAWFEIPAEDISIAKKFYQHIFDIEMIDMDLGEELKMAMFPVEENGVGGALWQHKDFYHPGHEGALVYFNDNPDLQIVLDKVEPKGGKIVQTNSK